MKYHPDRNQGDKEAEEMVRLLYAKKRGEKVDIDKKRLKALLKKYEG
jgi:hypothetical protein